MMRSALVIGLVSAALAVQSLAAGGLTLQERKGKQIYLRGINSEGVEIAAFMGDPPMEVPGSVMACVNCHGYDGRGRPEGGVIPSDVTWEYLTKPYGVKHPGGRRHPPYDDATLERSIVKGLDPAGNKLHVAMPFYEMSREDMTDLIAYMKRLGKILDPGLTETTIILGTIIPDKGPMAEVGLAIESVLRSYFQDLNQQGGICNRKIDLRVAHLGDTAKGTAAKLERFAEEEQIFAMVGAYIAGADKELTAFLQEKEVPLVGPTTLYPVVEYPLNRYIFYLFSGHKEQTRALAAFAAEGLRVEHSSVAAVYPDSALSTETAELIEKEFRQRHVIPLARFNYPPGRLNSARIVDELSARNSDLIFFLGPDPDAVELVQEAERRAWFPEIFFPGSLAGKGILEVAPRFKGKIYLSLPLLPSDQTPEGLREYLSFAGRHQLSSKHLAIQLLAYCAGKVLVEGLKLSGKDVSREKLITALEGLYRFNTGLMQPVTYGPNRRIGALGAHIMTVDMEKGDLVPVGGWVEIPE